MKNKKMMILVMIVAIVVVMATVLAVITVVNNHKKNEEIASILKSVLPGTMFRGINEEDVLDHEYEFSFKDETTVTVTWITKDGVKEVWQFKKDYYYDVEYKNGKFIFELGKPVGHKGDYNGLGPDRGEFNFARKNYTSTPTKYDLSSISFYDKDTSIYDFSMDLKIHSQGTKNMEFPDGVELAD